MTTKEQEIIKKTKNFVKEKLSGEGSGHDWWHIYRVYQTAIKICEEEKGNLFIVKLAALLHDIADWKFNDGDDKAGGKEARKWLKQLKVEEEKINQVCQIIDNLSFKGAGEKNKIKTLEGKIVQDADRIDALGAIGIARTFAYGGFKKREIYNPHISPTLHQNFEEYKKSEGTSFNHFYEKILLLKDQINTKSALKIAEKRHQFLENYVEQFLLEWKGQN